MAQLILQCVFNKCIYPFNRSEKQCSTQYEQKYTTINERVCNKVTETKVDYVTKPKCSHESEVKGHEVPEMVCNDVEKQHCVRAGVPHRD